MSLYCQIADCENIAEWKCSSGFSYCPKHKTKHGTSHPQQFHTFKRLRKLERTNLLIKDLPLEEFLQDSRP